MNCLFSKQSRKQRLIRHEKKNITFSQLFAMISVSESKIHLNVMLTSCLWNDPKRQMAKSHNDAKNFPQAVIKLRNASA